MNELVKTAAERLKTKVMNDFNKDVKTERGKHADSVIRNHILFSMGAGGFIPFPVVDVLAVGASQLDMIRQLCRVYDMDFAETQGKAIVSSLTTATLGRLAAGSLVKMIPVVGTYIGGVTNAAMAGASTYALGQVFKIHLQTGGTILDFDTSRLKKMYREQFEKGKKVAEELRQQQAAKKQAEEAAAAAPPAEPSAAAAPPPASAYVPSTDTFAKLKELADLKTAGIITEEEFERMKKKLVEGF